MKDNSDSRKRTYVRRVGLILGVVLGSFLWLYGQPLQDGSVSEGTGFSPGQSLIVILILLLISAFFSAAESSLTSVRHSWVRMLTEQKHPLASYFVAFKSEPSRFLSTIQVGQNLVTFLASAVAATNLSEPLHRLLVPIEQAIGLSLLGVSVAVVAILTAFSNVILGETVPRSIGIMQAERVATWIVVPLAIFDKLFLIPILLVNLLTRSVLRLFKIQMQKLAPIVSEEELRVLVEAGEEQGVIEEEEKEMIQSIFEFTDTIVREVMTPRVDMKCVAINTDVQEVIALIQKTGHSRIPVYEGSVDNILGIVHAKDLLQTCEGGRAVHLSEVMRPAYFVPESKRVIDLLQDLRRQRTHMAIVQDEYGGTAGLVTLEDLVEEIVGEIQDEYDVEPQAEVEALPDGSLIIDARMHLDDASELLKVPLESEEFDTLGGYVFGMLGHQPALGETVTVDGWQLKVHALEGHRIRAVQAIPHTSESSDSEEVASQEA